jgi:opacity protein-like surface antigen
MQSSLLGSELQGRRCGRSAALVLLAVMGLVSAASAQSGAYVGLRGGASDGPFELGHGAPLAEVFGGYRFNERWALELGLLERHDDSSYRSSNYMEDGDAHWRGLTASVRADFPMGRFGWLYGRAGVGSYEVERDVRAEATGGDLIQRARVITSESGLGGVVALGAEFRVGTRWRLGVELQQHEGDFRIGCDIDGIVTCDFNERASLRAVMASVRVDF